jgi:hypothetical protein
MLCKSFDKRGFACARGTMEQQPELVRITRDLILSFLLSVERSIPAQREERERECLTRSAQGAQASCLSPERREH